jgi:hypothetical protein
MPKPSPVRRILIISDTHIGSRYALVPPSFRASHTGPAGVFMSYMWDCWQDMLKRLPPLDCIIINGDSMEGEHPTLKSAPDALEVSPLRQIDMAIETLGPLRDKSKHLWLIRGTGFHEGKWNEALEALGRELHAERWADRRYSGEVLDGDFYGLKINAAHAMSIGAIYQGTLADRTARFMALAESLGKTLPADLIVRSHVHQTGLGRFMARWVLVTRCWKLINPYAVARMEYSRAAASLDLGGHLITLSDDGISFKDYAYQPHKGDYRKLA